MFNFEQLLISIFRTKLCGAELPEEIAEQIKTNPALLTSLYEVSAAHDLAHIVGEVLFEQKLIDQNTEQGRAFFAKRELAEYRYVQMDYDFQEICAAFEKAKIPYMPLKGSVLRNYYPEPAMRTSCDIDILVHPEDLDRATTLLNDELGYTIGEKYVHDVSIFTPNEVHLELHFHLTDYDEAVDRALGDVWQRSLPSDTRTYCRLMPPELFMFYHISHMAKHFKNGGCGVRAFMDIYVMLQKWSVDEEKVDSMLDECRLLRFGKEAKQVAEVWFSGGEHTEITQAMANYVLTGGSYGTLENKILFLQNKEKGGVRYVLKRIFLPYGLLKEYYTRLEKFPVLYPYYLVKRFFRVLFKNRKHAMSELKYATLTPKEQKRRIAKLCDDLEI